MRIMKSNRGITLIMLVITIIVIIVLAGVIMANLTSDNNMVDRAQEAKREQEKSSENEITTIGDYATTIQQSVSGKNEEDDGLWVEKLNASVVRLDATYQFRGGSSEEDIDTLIISSNGDFYYAFGDGTIAVGDAEIKQAIEGGMAVVTSNSLTLNLDPTIVFTFYKTVENGVDVYKATYVVDNVEMPEPFIAQN